MSLQLHSLQLLAMLCINLFVCLFGSYTSCTELAGTWWGGLSRIGLTGPPGTNYAVMKKAFDEGWGAVIAKTVSLDSSKARTPTSPRHGADGTQRVEQSSSYIHQLKQLMVPLTTGSIVVCISEPCPVQAETQGSQLTASNDAQVCILWPRGQTCICCASCCS